MARRFWFGCAALAAFTFSAPASAAVLEPLNTFGGGDGVLAAGERNYLGTANNERGLAYNPVTNNVYVVSRTGGNNVAILNGDTGAEVGVVALSGVSQGTFPVNQIRVADDGAIYIANLSTGVSAAAPFKVYRYANEAALLNNEATVAFNNPAPLLGLRYGDTFNVRGSGAATQLIAGAGSAYNNVAVFSTEDGQNFTATQFALPGLANAGDAANGVAFGSGNQLYTKQVGDALRLFDFDTAAGTVNLVQTYAASGTTPLSRTGPIDVDTVNALLAGLSISGTGVDSLRLLDLTDPAAVPESDFQEYPLPDNANTNVAGAVDIGNGRVYVLDTNNGLMALVVVPEPASLAVVGMAALGLLRRRRRA